MSGKHLFHVHTYRCGHAENVPDEAYVTRALQLGASDIWFSDHAPFPGDPFGNRMRYFQLPEYIDTLQSLKKRYEGKINVHVGLEVEYFPSFNCSGYYRELRANSGIEFLLLGQHMAELKPSQYSFSMDETWLIEKEYKALGDAMVQGMTTGYFDFVAHPDRIFRRCRQWTPEMKTTALEIINTAQAYGIPLEQNEESKHKKRHYWPEFWNLVEENIQIIHGLDAHSVDELEAKYYIRKDTIAEASGDLGASKTS